MDEPRRPKYVENQEVSVRQSDLRGGQWFRAKVANVHIRRSSAFDQWYTVIPLTGNTHSLWVNESDIQP